MDTLKFTLQISILRYISLISGLFVISSCLLILYDISPSLAAHPGTIDTSFSGDGTAILDINNKDDSAKDVAIQADGKILVAGTCDTETPNPCFAVARFNGNGSLDSTFGTKGVAQTSFTGDGTYVGAMAVQSDGKIVVVGPSGVYNNTAITLVRYTAGGELDTAFDSDGIVTTVVVAATHNWGSDLAIQPDGKILVAGTVVNSNYDFVLIRYNTDGSLDTTFGTKGITTTDLGDWNFGYALALQKDGKIIVGGRSRITTSNYDFALARYDSDGTLDTSFGGTGFVITPVTDSSDSINRLIVQPDDKILAVGMVNSSELALARYLPTGALDTSFDGDGIAATTLGETGHDVTLQDNGKILASGSKESASTDLTDLVVARFTVNGILDPEFGNNGLYTLNLGEVFGNAGKGIAMQRNGRIITTGRINNGTDIDSNFDFLLVRLYGDMFSWPMILPAITGKKNLP